MGNLLSAGYDGRIVVSNASVFLLAEVRLLQKDIPAAHALRGASTLRTAVTKTSRAGWCGARKGWRGLAYAWRGLRGSPASGEAHSCSFSINQASGRHAAA